jgi:hypothetical protein
MTPLRLEALDESARAVLEAHAAIAHAEGFYPAGGTALALQLGHRRSVDFDWFTDAEFDPLMLARRLGDGGVPFVARGTARGTLHGTVLHARVSFLEFRYPRLAPLVDSWSIIKATISRSMRDFVG